MADQAVIVGCAATVAIAGFIMAIMKYSFSSQEREVSEHLSTLYGSNPLLKTKAEKAAEKKRKGKSIHLFVGRFSVTFYDAACCHFNQYNVSI